MILLFKQDSHFTCLQNNWLEFNEARHFPLMFCFTITIVKGQIDKNKS